jgi:hypothetical protein
MGDAHSFALAPFDRATQVPNSSLLNIETLVCGNGCARPATSRVKLLFATQPLPFQILTHLGITP